MNRSRFVAAAAAAVSIVPTTTRAQGLTTIRVATTPNESGAQVYYADDKGFFRAAGLDVKITNLNNGGLIGAGIAAGTFDIAQAGVTSVAQAHERGLAFRIVAPASMWVSERASTALVTTKSSTLKTGKDFSGKTIAVNGLQNMSHMGVEAWVDKTGGDVTAVRWLELPFSEMPSALAQKRIDAAVIAEPVLHDALDQDLKPIALPYDALAKTFLISAWFATADYIKSHPDIVRKYAAVMYQTAKWANTNPDESGRVLEKYTKLKTAPGMARVLYPEKSDPAMVQPVIDTAVKFKLLKAGFPARDIFADLGA